MSRLPSDEQLGAFFDGELPPDEHQAMEALIAASPETRKHLEDLALLNALGPRIEEQLPSDLYWEDLPDRILARISLEDQHEALAATHQAAPERVSWWQRFRTPAGTWATAAVAVAALAGGGYLLAGHASSSAPSLAENRAPVAGPASESATPVTVHPGAAVTRPESVPPLGMSTDLAANRSPEELYVRKVQRVFKTLGINPGQTSLDGGPTVPEYGASAFGTPIQRVSLGDGAHPDGTPSLSELGSGRAAYFLSTALEAERAGERDLAREGFDLVTHNTDPRDRLYRAADAGLTRCNWQRRLEEAGDQRAPLLKTMFQEAERRYVSYLQGNVGDCIRARNLYSCYAEYGGADVSAASVRYARARMKELMTCDQ